MLDFDFLLDFLRYLESLELMFLWLLFILNYLGKFKANFEVLNFCSIRIKDLACFFKNAVNNAFIRVTISLIFKDSFVDQEMYIDLKTKMTVLLQQRSVSKNRRKEPPEMIKEELLLSLLENVDENESRVNEVVRNENQPN